LLTVEYPLRLQALPQTEERFMDELTYRGQPYPLPRMVRKMKAFAKRAGFANKATKAFLSNAAAYAKGEATSQLSSPPTKEA
jgi:hypothetical protein